MSDNIQRLVVVTGTPKDEVLQSSDGVLIADFPETPTECQVLRDAIYDKPAWAMLFGAVPRVHDYHAKRDGTFARAIRGITTLIRHGIPLAAMIPVTRSNHFLLPEMMDLCLRLGIAHVELLPAMPPVVQEETPQRWMGRYSVMAGDVAAALKRAKSVGLQASVNTWPLCMAGGIVLSSGSWEGVSLHVSSESSWKGVLPLLQAGEYPQACSRCAQRSACPGLFGVYIELYGTEEVLPFRGQED